jgi:crossover junction endodeoxyribonuclease RuvC
MKYIGIDVSTRTGIAAYDPNAGVVMAEEIVFRNQTGLKRAGMIAGKVLACLYRVEDIGLIGIEGYGFSNKHTLVTLVEIGTVIRYFLQQEGYPYREIPPTSLKKFVTGKGNAKKDHMMLEVYKRWGFTPETDNIADAVGLAHFAAALKNDLAEPLPKAHMEAVKKIS